MIFYLAATMLVFALSAFQVVGRLSRQDFKGKDTKPGVLLSALVIQALLIGVGVLLLVQELRTQQVL